MTDPAGTLDLSAVAARWEWRTFGNDLAEVGGRLAALAVAEAAGATEPPRAALSEEVYFLSALRDANVKVRDGLMDIKQLERTDGDGLEQWRPVLKAAFPVAAETLHQVFAALSVPVAAAVRSRPAWELAEVLAELVPAEPRLRAVRVRKVRTRYQAGGCMCETTRVEADGREVTTLAVESTDPAAVLALVRRLGLDGRANQSYPRGLKSLIGMSTGAAQAAPQRAAVLDLGTNSIKFHVAERAPDGAWRSLVDRAQVTRLGDGLRETGEIAPAAWARTLEAVCAMAAEARALGAAQVLAVGTMGLRNARNSDAFIAAVREHCGVAVEVIDGAEEARLAYLAVQAAAGLPDGAVTVFDTGGGSTQVTIGRAGRVQEQFSLDVGAVRVTEQFGLGVPVGAEPIAAARAAIARELARLDGTPPPDALIGLGGAVTNLTAVSLGMTRYDPDRIRGAVLTSAEVERQIALYAGLDAAGRAAVPGVQPGRADIILAGALIIRTLMEKLRQDQLTVTDRGLRHGVLLERFPLP